MPEETRPSGLLTGKTAIVTGGAMGLGEAIVFAYAREGAAVVVADINDQLGQQTVAQIEAGGGRAVFQHADVREPAHHAKLVEVARERFGRLDIACNNAGIGGDLAHVADLSLEQWQQVISINLTGVFLGLRAQIPAMLDAGGGSIINMSSIFGQVGFESLAPYTAAKHGVIGLTKAAAIEYGTRGIRLNAIGPAFINTRLTQKLDEDTKQHIVGLHALGRIGEPHEVAELAAWLASDRASFVTGSYYTVDGGYLAR